MANAQPTKKYIESLEKDIGQAKMVKDFLKSDYWLTLIKPAIEEALPKTSPYSMADISSVKIQGGQIAGLTFIERYLMELLKKAEDADTELLKIKNEKND